MTGALISLVLLAVMFVPLERAFAARPQSVWRPRFGTDLMFFVGQQLLFVPATTMVLLWVAWPLRSLPLLGLREGYLGLPWGVQAVIAVLLGDVLTYWGHRAAHRIPVLWRFHRVHHSARQLDWMAAWREHPLDGLYTMTTANLPALILGVPMGGLAALAAFRGLWGVFLHSNVVLRLGPLGMVVGSPHHHHWHHDEGIGGQRNFANHLPVLDWIFGTLHHPPGEPERLGVKGHELGSYLGSMVEPLAGSGRPRPHSAPAEVG